MYVKLSLGTTRTDDTPGTAYSGSNSTAPNTRAALSALLRAAADQLDNDQIDDVAAFEVTGTATP